MAKYGDIVKGYREKQGDLRRQIVKLKGRIKTGSAEAGTAAVIQRAERQIADLDGAIARCREKSKGWIRNGACKGHRDPSQSPRRPRRQSGCTGPDRHGKPRTGSTECGRGNR